MNRARIFWHKVESFFARKSSKKEQTIIDIYPPVCDKCGQIVPIENSALAVQDLATSSISWSQDRHLYPTAEGCQGSPSRVKLVEADSGWGAAYRKLSGGER